VILHFVDPCYRSDDLRFGEDKHFLDRDVVDIYDFDLRYDLEGNASEDVVQSDIILIFHFFTADLHNYCIDTPYMDSSSGA
jgi:hypothetical protein